MRRRGSLCSRRVKALRAGLVLVVAERIRPASRYTDRMTETTLYEKLLGIERPWRVRDVRLALEQGDVEVGVEFAGETLVCPACGAACPGYDRRPREWRHLDTMQYRTLVRAEVPRVRCAEHGVQQVRVPWAEAQSRFTALFEAMVIDWLKVASFAAVARQCRLSWE